MVPAEIVKPGTVVSVANEPTRSKLAALYHYATPLDAVFVAVGCFCKAGLGFLQTYVLIIFGEFFVIDGGRSYIEMGEFMLWAMCIFGAAILGVECTSTVKAPQLAPCAVKAPQLAPCASPPQGAPGGSEQLGTPRKRPAHWVPSHSLGCSSEPPPKPPISPPLTTQGHRRHLP